MIKKRIGFNKVLYTKQVEVGRWCYNNCINNNKLIKKIDKWWSE